jgi:hypothetical protein
VIPRDHPIPALLEFIASWVPGLTAQHRMEPSSIPGFIPPPLRAIYEIAGNWPVPNAEQWRPPRWIPGLFGPQDQLLPLEQLVVKGGRFKFIHENQGVWSAETLINEADPPVFSDASTIDGTDEGMREVCPSLAHFLTTFCLQELVFGSANLFCVESEPEHPAELVNGAIEPLWLDGLYANSGARYWFYLGARDLMIMHTGMGTPCDFWLAYNKEQGANLLGSRHQLRRIH